MSKSNLEPFHILLVEDDPDTLRLVSQHLKMAFGLQLKLHSESNIESAIALFDSFHIDLVITDLDLTDRNGFHLLRSAKKIDPLIQVILFTGHESVNAFHSALSLGADEFFIKPVAKDDLIECVSYLAKKVSRWRQTLHHLQSFPYQVPSSAKNLSENL